MAASDPSQRLRYTNLPHHGAADAGSRPVGHMRRFLAELHRALSLTHRRHSIRGSRYRRLLMKSSIACLAAALLAGTAFAQQQPRTYTPPAPSAHTQTQEAPSTAEP